MTHAYRIEKTGLFILLSICSLLQNIGKLKLSKLEEKETIFYRKKNLLSLSTVSQKVHLDALCLEQCKGQIWFKTSVLGLYVKVLVVVRRQGRLL